MDYLDNLIQLADVHGEINVLCRFCGDWQMHKEAQPRGIFHIITLGQCQVQANNQIHTLRQGDIIFFPNGLGHLLGTQTQPQTTIKPGSRIHGLFELHQKSENYDFEMFCGYFEYAQGALLPKMMPDFWILSGQKSVTMPIVMILQQEAKAQLGSRVIINSLCHVLLTYLVRDYLSRGDAMGHNILAALQDKRLFHTVDAMLKQPEKPWNMVKLAELCAMSRANFIRLFKQKTNTLPGKFLLDLRMQKAQILLKNTNKSVLNIALEVGYQSESHFSKVFKTHSGLSPSRYRAQTKDS